MLRKTIVKKQPEMKLHIGLKISLTRDDGDNDNDNDNDLTSFPLFLSGETETMVIITAHLKGFVRDNVGMKISDDRAWITISWKKPVWEIMIKDKNVHKEIKMIGFSKAFRVPDGVVLDRLEANFTQHDSKLTISIPKLVRGIDTIKQVDNKPREQPEKVTDDDREGKNKTDDDREGEKKTGDEFIPEIRPFADSKQPNKEDNNVPEVTSQEHMPTQANYVHENEEVEDGEPNLAKDELELADNPRPEVKTQGVYKVAQVSAVLGTCLALLLHSTRK